MALECLSLRWQIFSEEDGAGVESEPKMAATTCLETKIGAGEEEAAGAILLFISKPVNKVHTKQDQYTTHTQRKKLSTLLTKLQIN